MRTMLKVTAPALARLALVLLLTCSPSQAVASPQAGLIGETTSATVASLAAAPGAQGVPAVRLDTIASGFDQPIHVTNARDGSGRLFVVEKRGRIRIVRGGTVDPTPFLNIRSLVKSSGSEQGLLGLAFHPRFASNGLFYVNYTDQNGVGNTVVARYRVSPGNPNQADPNSATTVLSIEQPATNHNGGNLVFGPDGYLYIGTGDGGGAGDPWGNAQNKGVLLGKMLRIDVDAGQPYAIPPDNPFVNEPGARPEIWAYGLRNPWRYSFDRANGVLYIGDVGQNTWEWFVRQRSGIGGRNYGWNRVEGGHCFPPGSSCDPSAYAKPKLVYDHSGGNCSITGGHVYRGPSFPQLQGIYFYGDFCSGRLWAGQKIAPGQWRSTELLKTDARISSFGEDEAGELYLVGLGDGRLYRLVAQ